MKRQLLLALATVAVISTALVAQPGSKPSYEVYAVRFATLANFPVASLVKGDDPARRLDLAMVVWLVKGNGRNVLVDSGFYRDQFFKEWNIVDFVKPSEALAQAGVKPEDITDVLISHMH